MWCMERSTPIDRVLGWSSYLTAEEKMHYDVINVDFISMDYYWTKEFRSFVEGLSRDSPSFIFLVGLQGSGKTSALRVIERFKMNEFGCYYWRWGEDIREKMEYLKECTFLLIDLPDYEAGGGGRMKRDLDGIGKLWYEFRYGFKYHRRSMVVAVQKEMFGGHYLFGKGEVFELRPLTPNELVNFYFRKFSTVAPFDEQSLALVGRLSRGVFRRFIRYVRLCVQDMQGRCVEAIDVVDVRRVISIDVISRDMALELSGFLRGYEREQAVAAMTTLMKLGGMNQKELAADLGSTPSSLGRLLQKLELRGYVMRVRGERKEMIVKVVEP